MIALPGNGLLGFATSKKIGAKPRRNRALRRFREAVRLQPQIRNEAYDFVVIVNVAGAEAAFQRIQEEVRNLFGLAIINQPQVGILRMGEIKKRPVVVEIDGEDAIAIRTMMYLALSYDHRVIDGVLGNSFLYRAARILEEADFEL